MLLYALNEEIYFINSSFTLQINIKLLKKRTLKMKKSPFISLGSKNTSPIARFTFNTVFLWPKKNVLNEECMYVLHTTNKVRSHYIGTVSGELACSSRIIGRNYIKESQLTIS